MAVSTLAIVAYSVSEKTKRNFVLLPGFGKSRSAAKFSALLQYLIIKSNKDGCMSLFFPSPTTPPYLETAKKENKPDFL